jgi:hypothetical protein
MLIQFTLLIFGFVGIAALVIDMGYVSLSRLQMQAAADAAALEGVGQGRAAAHDMAAAVFAGPRSEIVLSGGVTEIHANQLLSISDGAADVYRPDLETNSGNATEGDMVSGAYVYPPAASSCDAPVPFSHECQDYTRNDFTPDPAGSALLVRLRRTNEAGIAGGSAGKPLPVLFGRLTLLETMSARATAIADPRGRALRVGLPNGAIEGVTPFALDAPADLPPGHSSIWPALVSTSSVQVTVNPSGLIFDALSQVVGVYPDPSQAPLLTVGQEVPDIHSASACFDVTGYVPLYQPIAGTPRVIGFGHVKLTALGPCPGAVQITLLAAPSAGNATAHLVDGIPVASPADAAAVLAANETLTGLLQVPVLVR